MTKLSDTQRIILSRASQRDDRLAVPPERLPAAARQTVAKSLLKQGLVSEEPVSANNARGAWQIDGRPRLLRITDGGLRAIGVELEETTAVDEAELGGLTAAEHEEEQALAQAALDADVERGADAADGQPAQAADGAQQPDAASSHAAGQGESLAALPAAPPPEGAEAVPAPQRPSVSSHGGSGRSAALRVAAAAILTAWDAPGRDGLDGAVAALRAAFAGRPARQASAPRQPRGGTKQETVLALLRRDEGATIAQDMETTGWQQHTVRGFLAGLKRKGITVEVLERVRQVGPDKQGAKGSYSIYRVAAATAPSEAG